MLDADTAKCSTISFIPFPVAPVSPLSPFGPLMFTGSGFSFPLSLVQLIIPSELTDGVYTAVFSNFVRSCVTISGYNETTCSADCIPFDTRNSVLISVFHLFTTFPDSSVFDPDIMNCRFPATSAKYPPINHVKWICLSFSGSTVTSSI